MSKFRRPCQQCQNLYSGNGDYCLTCTQARAEKRNETRPPRINTPQLKQKKAHLYGGDYKKRAALVRATATHCHICHKQFTETDIIHADHLYPELGHYSPLAAAHKTCNEKRGNKPIT